MNFEEFKTLVEQNSLWFGGDGFETADSLSSIEAALRCVLPPSMKWLVAEFGYSKFGACGLDGLGGSVEITNRCRQNLALPDQYIILNDWNDAGVVCFDQSTLNAAGEYKIYWTVAHNINRLAEGEAMDNNVTVFEDYPAWVLSRLAAAQEFFEDEVE